MTVFRFVTVSQQPLFLDIVMQRLGTTYKLTLLLALLSTVPVIALVFNQTTEQVNQQNRVRLQICQETAQQCAALIQANKQTQLTTTLAQLAETMEGFKSLRLIRFDGKIIHELGMHDAQWEESKQVQHQDQRSYHSKFA